MLFDDRFWWFKFLLAAAALVVLGHDMQSRAAEREPKPAEVLANPAPWVGKAVWLGPWKVLETSVDGFSIGKGRVRIQVLARGGPRPAKDSWVRVRGTWWEGGVVRAEEVRPLPDYPFRRAVIYGYSLAALGLLFFLLARRFELRRKPPLLVEARRV